MKLTVDNLLYNDKKSVIVRVSTQYVTVAILRCYITHYIEIRIPVLYILLGIL